MTTSRKIVQAIRRPLSTLLKLECGHDRSIGGHVFADGTSAVALPYYLCNDGFCYSATPASETEA